MAIRRIHTENTEEVFSFLQDVLGKSFRDLASIYDEYITFNFISHSWFTLDHLNPNISLNLTNEDFIYFIDLHLIGVNVTHELILATLEELTKENNNG